MGIRVKEKGDVFKVSKLINFPSSQNDRQTNWIDERCNSLLNTIILDESLIQSERCAIVLILQDFCGNYLADRLFSDKDYEKYKDEEDK